MKPDRPLDAAHARSSGVARGARPTAQEGDPGSTLELHRAALAGRPHGDFAWLDGPPGSLVFRRGEMICVVNVDAPEVELPAGELVLASVPDVHDRLPANTAAWVRAERGAAR